MLIIKKSEISCREGSRGFSDRGISGELLNEEEGDKGELAS